MAHEQIHMLLTQLCQLAYIQYNMLDPLPQSLLMLASQWAQLNVGPCMSIHEETTARVRETCWAKVFMILTDHSYECASTRISMEGMRQRRLSFRITN